MSRRSAWGTTAALVVAAAVVLGLLAGTVQATRTAAATTPPPQPKPAVIKVTVHRLALYGDSLLDPGPTVASSVAGQLAADLPTARVIDLCLNEGAPTVLERSKQALDARPDVLVVAVGSVDAAQSLPVSDYTTAVHTMLATVAMPPTRMLVLIPPPQLYQTSAQLSFFHQYTDVLRAEARVHGATVIDTGQGLVGADYVADGTALSAAGDKVVAAAIEARL